MHLPMFTRGAVAMAATVAVTAALALVPTAAFAAGPAQPTISYGSDGQDSQVCASYLPGTITPSNFKNGKAWTLGYTSTALPSGLSLDPTSGTISGVAAADASYGTENNFDVTVYATNTKAPDKVETAQVTHAISLNLADPVITTGSVLAPATVGEPYSQQINAESPCDSVFTVFTATGLPDGLTISPDGKISGTPAFSNTYRATTSFDTVTITATNGSATRLGSVGVSEDTDTFSLELATPAPEFTSGPPADGVRNTAYNQVVTATSPGPVTFTVKNNGSLPDGLTLDSSGVISGTPTQIGTSRFSVKATSGKQSVSSRYSISIDGITTASLHDGVRTADYSDTVESTWNPARFEVTRGELPGGLTLHTETGEISGVPTELGSFDFNVTATEVMVARSPLPTGAVSPSDTQSYTIAIAGIDNMDLSAGWQTAPYSQQLTSSWDPDAEYALTNGALPTGLELNANGSIVGTPTTSGNFVFSVSATNGDHDRDTQSYSIRIKRSPVLVAADIAFGTTGEAFDRTIRIKGSKISSSLTGDLPAGVQFDNGVFSGTPTETGTFSVTVTATNRSGSAMADYEFSIYATPAFTTTALNSGYQSVTFSTTVAATGYQVQYTSDALPQGLLLDAETGIISGKTAETGTFAIALTATNPAGASTKTLDLTIVEASQVLSAGTVTSGGALTVTGSGFEPNEPGEIYLNSVRTLIGTFTADANGNFVATVTIPAATPAGLHHIEAVGSISGIHQFTAITVSAPATTATAAITPGLASTGANTTLPVGLATLLLMLGAAAVFVTRRRTTAGVHG